jgi:hypothetical protein
MQSHWSFFFIQVSVKRPLMLIGFPLERTLLVGGADDHDGIAVAVKFHVIWRFHRELLGFVANGF